MSSISTGPGTITISLNSAGNFVYNGVVQTSPLTVASSSGTLTVNFDSQGNTITSANGYIILNSSNIVFDGQNIPVNVSATSYLGFLRKNNGAFNAVIVQNVDINVVGAGSLGNGGGWVLQNSTRNITVNNCSSNGIIPAGGGGIIGGGFAAVSYSITCNNCRTSGDISTDAGGIIGTYANAFRSSGEHLTVQNCFSTGSIGAQAGGIIGTNVNFNSSNVTCTIIGCYSAGNIGFDSGGIYAYRTNFSNNGISDNCICTATNCYSIGTIGQFAGGIYGSEVNRSAGSNSKCTATNCYSIGDINSVSPPYAGGIFGASAAFAGPPNSCLAISCYSKGTVSNVNNIIFGDGSNSPGLTYCYGANGVWSDVAASGLTGLNISATPNIWSSIASNTPYVLEYFKNSWNNPLPPVPSNNYNKFFFDTNYDFAGFYLSTPSGLPAYPNTGLIYNYTFLNKNAFTGAPGGAGVTGFFNGFNFNLGNQFYNSPVTIQNTNPGSGQLNVFLNSYRNINTFTNNYLTLGTDKITFDGQYIPFSINVANYPGLLSKTGTFSNTIVQNVVVNSATFGILSSGGGWIGQTGWNGGEFINCGASGPIPTNGGGIVGSSSANIICTNCNSNGAISTNGGGIAGSSGTNVSCIGCFQNGTAGTGAGTLFGANTQTGNAAQCFASNRTLAGSSSTNVTYVNCFGLEITPQGKVAYNLVIDD